MGRKILGWFVLIVLVVGSISGAVFTTKYLTEGGSSKEDVAYIQALEARLDDLEEERIQLLLEIAELEEDNAYTKQLRGQVNDLTAQIEALKEELAYYKQLLQAYQDSEKYVVEFYSNGTLFDIKLVDPDACVNVILLEEPTKTDYIFTGWAFEGTTEVVDLSTTPITTDTAFEAVFSPVKEILFSGEEEIVSGESVYDVAVILGLFDSFPEITFSDDIQLTLDVFVCNTDGEIANCKKVMLRRNQNSATIESSAGIWASVSFVSETAIKIDLTGLYSITYARVVVYEIARIL